MTVVGGAGQHRRTARPDLTALLDALPAGLVCHATAVLRGAAAALDRAIAGPGRWQVDPDALVAHLLLPHVLAAVNDLPAPTPPPAPCPAPGGGWLSVDLGPEDGPSYEALLAVLDAEVAAGAVRPDAEAVARRAQEWRLAVTPFRSPPALGPPLDRDHDPEPALHRRYLGGHDGRAGRAGGAGTGPTQARPLAGVRVLDLTVMWAGPLATWLLAEVGADVIKIEPACRPDGLRRGARPSHAGPGNGAHFVALDHGKRHQTLDLREASDRARFDELLDGADVLVDNFSRRVRPNLAIAPDQLRRRRPELIDVSITAFPAGGPEAGWVAYGGGVHAASGLAHHPTAAVPFRPAPLPYPDPLAGLVAFATIVDALVAGRAGHRALSLFGAVAPLVGLPDTPPVQTGGLLGRLSLATVDRCRVPAAPLRPPAAPTPGGFR
jgi:hypothetical protein